MKCKICSFVAKNRTGLAIHMNVHNKEPHSQEKLSASLSQPAIGETNNLHEKQEIDRSWRNIIADIICDEEIPMQTRLRHACNIMTVLRKQNG